MTTPFRQIGLVCPADSITACRADLTLKAPSLAGLGVELGPNSLSIIVSHYGGLGAAPPGEITELADLTLQHGLIYAYIGDGPEGKVSYTTYQDFLASQSIVMVEKVGVGDLPPA